MKKITIIVIIVVLIFIAYAIMISGNKSSSATGVTRQAVGNTAQTSGTATLDGPGKEFVTQLLAIQSIKFNLQFFTDPVYKGLRDWSREILPQETGRPNPFAPIDGLSSISNTTGFSGDIESAQNTSEAVSAKPVTQSKTPAKTTTTRTNTSTR